MLQAGKILVFWFPSILSRFFFSSITEVLLFIMPASMSHGELRSWKSLGKDFTAKGRSPEMAVKLFFFIWLLRPIKFMFNWTNLQDMDWDTEEKTSGVIPVFHVVIIESVNLCAIAWIFYIKSRLKYWFMGLVEIIKYILIQEVILRFNL